MRWLSTAAPTTVSPSQASASTRRPTSGGYNQTHFLIPNSGFPEFADGLQASCSALTGAAIKKVSTVPSTPSPAAPAITAADCQQIANAISATQLRAEPTQCNFKPLFSGTATPCGKGTKESVIWKDDFESGLVNWTQSRDYRLRRRQELPVDSAHQRTRATPEGWPTRRTRTSTPCTNTVLVTSRAATR